MTAGLEAVEGGAEAMRRSTGRLLPRHATGPALNLVYCLGFLRVSGQLEGARATDRGGSGKIHRQGEKRAVDTVAHFGTWIEHGPGFEQGRASLGRVRRMHEHYARQYPISNETMVHAVCLFAVQLECLFRLIGAPPFGQDEREAQVAHWRAIGEQLGAHDVPETWEGMERFVEWYEGSPAWFGPTPEGHRCAEALIAQFGTRWLPVGLRWSASPLLLSLLEDHVLEALGERKPPGPVVWLVRRLARAATQLSQRFPRRSGEPLELQLR